MLTMTMRFFHEQLKITGGNIFGPAEKPIQQVIPFKADHELTHCMTEKIEIACE